MFQKSVFSLVVAVIVAITSSQAVAQAGGGGQSQNVPALLVKANQAYAAGDYTTYRDSLEALHKLRPNNSEYMYQLVIAHALLNEKSQAYDLMLRMQSQGLAYDFTATDDTKNIQGTEVFDYVNDLMKNAAEPVGKAETVFTLPESIRLPEAFGWDESRQKFLIGTMAGGEVYAVAKDGQAEELLKADADNGLWAIIGVLADAPRNRLWVTSAAIPGAARFDPIDKGRSALFEFKLDTLEMVQRYPVPVDGNAHILGNMVLAPNGDLFAADRALPLVYSKPANEDKLKPVLVLKDMISQRGIAMQPDGHLMYVADREMGIAVIDFTARQAGSLAGPESLNLAGIDGLYLKDNVLYIIQNGIRPQRIMRLQLDADGKRIESVRPLAVAQPEFDFPSFGAIVGDDIYYFASSQGIGKAGAEKPVSVLRTPLDAGEDLVKPDMQLFLQKQAELRKQQILKEQQDKQN
jgi:sugar lactone lactonase YvrE